MSCDRCSRCRYGAEDDRRLGVPGEDLGNVLPARDFVGWYNGLPEAAALEVDLASAGGTAVILGQGNVAMDAVRLQVVLARAGAAVHPRSRRRQARILLKPPEALAGTDIAEHALEQLRRSAIRRVLMVGRRGPLEAAFTIKELREMSRIPGCAAVIPHEEVAWTPAEAAFAQATRPRKRFAELLATISHTPPAEPSPGREWRPVFRRSPAAFVEAANRPGMVGAVKLERTELVGEPGDRRAVGTGEFEEVPAGLVLRSIGYRSVPIDASLPFDHGRGVMPNTAGRVDGVPGLYVSGWLRTGGPNLPLFTGPRRGSS